MQQQFFPHYRSKGRKISYSQVVDEVLHGVDRCIVDDDVSYRNASLYSDIFVSVVVFSPIELIAKKKI